MHKLIDKHVHFTGSLPPQFIWKNILEKIERQEMEILLSWQELFPNSPNPKNIIFEQFLILIKNALTGDWEENITRFFKMYAFFQLVTKSKNRDSFYEDSTFEIAKYMNALGVSEFEIIAGPLIDIGLTTKRITKMMSGFEKFEKLKSITKCGKIRLTLIRDNKNNFRNVTKISLYEVFHLIETNSKIEERIGGFDFSGEENPIKSEELFDYLNEISQFNLKRVGSNKHPFPVSVHAGEDLRFKSRDYLNYFEKLLNENVSKIGHGTFLWIPEKYLKITKEENVRRQKLLKDFALKGVEFEICPTANLMLTPLASYKDIPLIYFQEIGLKYSINTDNPTIFSTNIEEELKNVLKYVQND